MCNLSNGYLEVEGIRVYGINNNRIVRNHNRDGTIIEEDVLINLNAEELINISW